MDQFPLRAGGGAMGAFEDIVSGWGMEEDEDPLLERLRRLEWVEVPSEVRARCWEAISARIDAKEQSVNGAEAHPADELRGARVGEQHSFSRCPAPIRPAVAHAWSRPKHARPARAALSFS